MGVDYSAQLIVAVPIGKEELFDEDENPTENYIKYAEKYNLEMEWSIHEMVKSNTLKDTAWLVCIDKIDQSCYGGSMDNFGWGFLFRGTILNEKDIIKVMDRVRKAAKELELNNQEPKLYTQLYVW